MRKTRELIKSLKKFEASIPSIIEKVVKENEELILDMNTEDQLFEKGVNRLDVPLDDFAPYKPFTVEVKKEKGQPFNRVTLRDEGDFHRSFYIDYNKDGFEIKATDEKAPSLEKKYGRQIFGLNEENFTDLQLNYVFAKLIEELRKIC